MTHKLTFNISDSLDKSDKLLVKHAFDFYKKNVVEFDGIQHTVDNGTDVITWNESVNEKIPHAVKKLKGIFLYELSRLNISIDTIAKVEKDIVYEES